MASMDEAIGWSILLYLINSYFILITYWIPALLTLIYFVFGNKAFIFNWVDSVLAQIIQYEISMITPFNYLISIALQVLFFYYNPEFRGFTTLYFTLYIA